MMAVEVPDYDDVPVVASEVLEQVVVRYLLWWVVVCDDSCVDVIDGKGDADCLKVGELL